MRKICMVLFALLIFAGLVTGCTSTPPVLDVSVTSGGVTEHRPALLSTKSWVTPGTAPASPDMLQLTKDASFPAFGIGDDTCSVELSFMKSSRSFSIDAYPKSGGVPSTVAKSISGGKTYTFTANDGYIYAVRAEFSQGEATYYFSVNKEGS